MANVASAEKKNRQRLKRRTRNLYHLTTMRSLVKKVRTALGEKNGQAAKAALDLAIRTVDKAAQKGVIKKKTAARTKSRLTTAVNHASTPPSA